jgi:uncharacterized protein
MAIMRILWILSDGKRGHENQSLGLAEAFARIQPCAPHLIELPHEESLLKRFARLREAIAQNPTPQWIFAAGHSTHLLLLYAGWMTGARTVVLMQPSLPMRAFDYCLIPRHDLKNPAKALPPNAIVTHGAVNRMRFESKRKDGSGVLLLGGPSRAYGWNPQELLNQVVSVVRIEPGRRWLITNSPRTPEGFMEQVQAALPQAEVCPVESTPADWLPQVLAAATVAWVSEDSVSMIYEALTAGARVGIFAMPAKGAESKHSRGVTELKQAGYVRTWDDWQADPTAESSHPQLAEADRCASLILGMASDD